MKILIDGDSCNVIECTERIAKSKNITCHICCDTKHLLESDYSEIHIVDSRRDSADFAILNRCGKYDIVITNDSGLAAMVLAKNGYVINSHGFEYTKYNIDAYLSRRHLRAYTARKTNKKQVKGVMERNKKDHPKHSYTKTLHNVIRKSEREEHEQNILY